MADSFHIKTTVVDRNGNLKFIQLGSILAEPEPANDFYDKDYEQEIMPTIPVDRNTHFSFYLQSNHMDPFF